MLLLVDYSSLLYRAYHSMPPTVPMHGVHGFLNMLTRVVGDRRPDRLGLAVDDDWRPAFRVDALPMYKAQRVGEEGEVDPVTEHEILGREILKALGLAVVGYEGFEAEDVIASLAAREPGPIEVLSGDRDLFALVRDHHLSVLYPLRGVSQLTVVDEAEITRRYGIPGRSYGDFALLRGDPSDGLPGVPGIGEKTAARLVAQYGSLAGILDAPSLPVGVAGKLRAAAEYLTAAVRVVLPVEDSPLPPVDLALPTGPADPEAVVRISTEFVLDGPVSRLGAALGWS